MTALGHAPAVHAAAVGHAAAELLEELLDFRGKVVHLALPAGTALGDLGVVRRNLDLDRNDRSFDAVDQRRERRGVLGQVGGGDSRRISGMARAERAPAEGAGDAKRGDRDRGENRVAPPLGGRKTGE